MRRRDFIMVIGGAAAWPIATRAQQPGRLRLIGGLWALLRATRLRSLWLPSSGCAYEAGMEGRHDLRVELRWGESDMDKIGSLAKELVELRPDAIFGQTTPVIGALARETRTIPIVFVTVSDPIGSGFAASLTHPGGNITGFTFVESAMGSKWVELLKEIAPRTVRVALLFNPATAPPLKFYMPSIQAAAVILWRSDECRPGSCKDEIEGVIAAQARNPGGSLIVMPDAFNATNHELIIMLAARYGVPAIYGNNFAQSGG